MNEILIVKNVSKSFGGLLAVNNVSIAIKEGEIHALIGPNGAGKTTLFNIITGFLKQDRGKIFYKGKRIDKFPPNKRVSLGIGCSGECLSWAWNIDQSFSPFTG